MLLNYNGSVSRDGETRSVFNLLHRFHRPLWDSWRRKGAPQSIAYGNSHFVVKHRLLPLAIRQYRRRPTLECLPFELLHMVFLEACTDGGRTGCSLSLVSKDIRTLSRAARFHSISLLTPSLWKLRLFQQAYDKARDAAIRENAPWTMPRVRHLCLVINIPYFLDETLNVKPAKQDFQYPEYGLLQGFRNHLLDILQGRRQDIPSDEFRAQIFQLERDYRGSAVVTLLEQVASDLFSLCLYQFPHLKRTQHESEESGANRPPYVRISSFPNLRELWLGGNDDSGVAPLFLEDTSFPALRRLHMRANLDTDVLHWLSAAPRMDDLRIVAGPRLLTVAEGQERLMTIAAHPIWRKQGKQLSIMVPLERVYTFGWPRFAQCASLLRQTLTDAVHPVVFVPYYATQDVDLPVRKAAEGKRRPWPLSRRDRWKPAAQEELFRRDWLARIDSWCGGIYVQDFWAHFVEDDECERRRIRESMGCLLSWEEPTYVAPLTQCMTASGTIS